MPSRIEDLPDSDAALTNLPALIEGLGLTPYHARGHRGQGRTIAVLDNGFAGLTASRGVRLPKDVKVEASARPDMLETNHGTKLAEIAYALATGSTTFREDLPGPKILLYNSNGFSNFRDAVSQVAARGDVDMVLYAQIWEYGGNADGQGFINREVDRALASGVLWINAAGNLGNATYGGKIAPLGNGDVALPHRQRYVRMVVPQSRTPVKIVLSWNDFDDSKDYRTPQDLDMVLEDSDGYEVAASRLVQSGDAGSEARDYSAHAREIMQATLEPGIYHIRVEAVSDNFDEQSRMRLTADGPGVRFLDPGEEDSVVLMPADNAEVIAVGAADVDYTSRAAVGKPELDVVSEVRFEGGAVHRGTSAAAAIAAGALAVYQSAHGTMSHAGVVRAAQRGLISEPKRACLAKPDGVGCKTPLLKLSSPPPLR